MSKLTMKTLSHSVAAIMLAGLSGISHAATDQSELAALRQEVDALKKMVQQLSSQQAINQQATNQQISNQTAPVMGQLLNQSPSALETASVAPASASIA
ncbi:MAG: hypothetical protein EOO68_26895, partial [Moraxellaceae bacterium]